MRRTRLHRNATMLDIMDRVLGKGIVVETLRDGEASRHQSSIAGIGFVDVDARVEVFTDFGEALRKVSSG